MVRDASQMSPDEQVQAAKERLRSAIQRVGEELGQTTQQLQGRVLETADGLKERVQGTLDHAQEKVQGTLEQVQERVQGTVDHVKSTTSEVGSQLSGATQKPLEFVRQKPLEGVAIALVAGLVVGLMSRSGSSGSTRPEPSYTEPYGEATSYAPTPTSPQRGGGLLAGLALGGVGKTIMDVVREEYLTPENIRYWVRELLPRRQP